MIFVIDTNVESLAIKEAIKLKIPIVAVLDSNSDPTGINFPIPGNDDARRSIDLYCNLIGETIKNAAKETPQTADSSSKNNEKTKKKEVTKNSEKGKDPKEKNLLN